MRAMTALSVVSGTPPKMGACSWTVSAGSWPHDADIIVSVTPSARDADATCGRAPDESDARGGRLIDDLSLTRPPPNAVRFLRDDYIESRETMSAKEVPSVATLRTSPFTVGIVTSVPPNVPASVPFRYNLSILPGHGLTSTTGPPCSLAMRTYWTTLLCRRLETRNAPWAR